MTLELVIDQRRRDLGGFEVGRVLPFQKRRMVGPFIFFDHIGPVDIPAGAAEVARRTASPTHWVVDGHLSVRRRNHAPGQRRLGAGDPPRRSELDDGRQGHHALGALREGARERRLAPRHPIMGRAAS